MTDVVALAAELLAIQSSTGAEGPAVDFVSRWLDRARLERHRAGSRQGARQRLGVARRRRRHAVDAPRHGASVHRARGSRSRGCTVAARATRRGSPRRCCAPPSASPSRASDRVDLLLVVGEEKGSDGARAANHLPATSKFLVNGEPTESTLASGREGLAARRRPHARPRRALRVPAPRRSPPSSPCSRCCRA